MRKSSSIIGKSYYQESYSLVNHISEIVPPTIVAPVDPNAPCKKRATMIVSIFLALVGSEEVSHLIFNKIQFKPYNAIMRYMSKNPSPETMYKGCRPNSLLKDTITRGTKPKPSRYTLKPMVAWKSVQCKSRIINGNPILYADEVKPIIFFVILLVFLPIKKSLRDGLTDYECPKTCYSCDSPFLSSREINWISLVSFLKFNL